MRKFEKGDLVKFNDSVTDTAIQHLSGADADIVGVVMNRADEFGIGLYQIYWMDGDTSLEKPHHLKIIQRC